MDKLSIIGRAEIIAFPEMGISDVYARIDTGAKTSSIWASEISENDGLLSVVFFGSNCANYTGQTVQFNTFKIANVASSNGYAEERYKISLMLEIGGRHIIASFTLADRSTQVYPVLIGRNVLAGKFLVNVKIGAPLLKEEKARELSKKRVAKKLNRKEGNAS